MICIVWQNMQWNKENHSLMPLHKSLLWDESQVSEQKEAIKTKGN